MSATPLPAGTVTFLFTDIQGSAALAQSHPNALPALLARHNAILHDAIACHHGRVFRTAGDAFYAAFATASDGLAAALSAQHALQHEPWQPTPLAVRMGLHTGEAWPVAGEVGDDYDGYLTLTRAQRVMDAAHGGQVLLSGPAAELVRGFLPAGVMLRDMGEHRLKGVLNPERLWQAVAPDLVLEFPPLRTLNAAPTNLPVQLTSFVGRGRDIGEVRELLGGTRLLTLTGVGGTGKTRLALQVAAEVVDEYRDGVWFVELAPLREETLVAPTVVSALRLASAASRPPAELLVEHLRDRRLLLVLDNCEHLVAECAGLTHTLLRAAPQLRILTTSRAPLGVEGETLYAVQPLRLPERAQAALPLATFTQYEAVRLFIVRARAARPDFAVTNANAPAVAQICYHLDGIPLAIELAAARVRALSPDQIAARLGDRFHLLTGGSRTALPRQQTLRATLDWSYGLLGPAERRLFARLAVFAGSFALEAVETICADSGADGGAMGAANGGADPGSTRRESVLDLLAGLVDQSLVICREVHGQNRHLLLETVREYALERLEVAGELTVLQDRHLDYYLALAQEGDPHILAGRPAWIDRFEAEYDNFRAAMVVALERRAETGVFLGVHLNQFASLNQRIYELYGWAVRLLALSEAWPPGLPRAAALWLAGDCATWLGDYKRGGELLNASLNLATELENPDLVGRSLLGLALLNHLAGVPDQQEHYARLALPLYQGPNLRMERAFTLWMIADALQGQGNGEVSRPYHEALLGLSREEDAPHLAAHALRSLGWLAAEAGDLGRAESLFAEAAELWRRINYSRALAYLLGDLGISALRRGDGPAARAYYREGLEMQQELTWLTAQSAFFVRGLAGAMALDGRDERATRLFGALSAAYERLDLQEIQFVRSVFDPIRSSLRARLGAARYDALWAEGRAFTLEQALAHALEG